MRQLVLAVLVVALASTLACEAEFKSPPVEVGYRDSLLGAGKILQLTNQSNVELIDLEVKITAGSNEVVFQEAALEGYKTLEVGWKKLGGFQIPEDAEVTVTAKGYLLPHNAKLSAATSAREAETETDP